MIQMNRVHEVAPHLPSHQLFQAINSSVISAHLISRALDRRMILDDIAKETFRELLALLPD